jgi:hypothetical protein
VGASGDASLGLGAGGKLLVGGSHKTISLQPLSLSGQVGVNLALGVAGLTLRWALRIYWARNLRATEGPAAAEGQHWAACRRWSFFKATLLKVERQPANHPFKSGGLGLVFVSFQRLTATR